MKLLAIISAALMLGCGTQTQQYLQSPGGQALLTGSEALAKTAVTAAATTYGGPAAGALASAGLDALGAVLQGYVGHYVPPSVVKASPGITSVANAVAPKVSSSLPVTQADVNAVYKAAAIAKSQ